MQISNVNMQHSSVKSTTSLTSLTQSAVVPIYNHTTLYLLLSSS